MKNFKTTYLLFAFLITFSACKKDNTGPQGPAGTNGTNGNANVHSQTFVVNPSDWVVNSTNLTQFITDMDITQEIIDNGSVQMFIYFGSIWWPLPHTNFSSTYSTTYSGSFYSNEFLIFVNRSDGAQPTVPGVALTFKVVTIGG